MISMQSLALIGMVKTTVRITEATEVLTEAPESLSEEAEPLELRVSWIKTKVQAFGDILNRPLSHPCE